MTGGTAHCRFCLANKMLIDSPLVLSEFFFLLGSIDPAKPAQAIVVPIRHVETPFELQANEWVDLGRMLDIAKGHLSSVRPDGYTIGWNVGAAAGQDVFHVHLHVIARFKGEKSVGRGLHAVLSGTTTND